MNQNQTADKVRVVVAYNDISTRGNGRRAVAVIIHEGQVYFPQECPIADNVTGRLPRIEGGYMIAAMRHCAVECDLPPGTLVVRWESAVDHYRVQRADLCAYRVSEEGELVKAKDVRCVRKADGDYVIIGEEKVKVR
ncbi:MAG: hypothetical protein RML84_11535 [Anaerolineae bacterium]|nr:hypothetical protein [Anaerolineae bacterium]